MLLVDEDLAVVDDDEPVVVARGLVAARAAVDAVDELVVRLDDICVLICWIYIYKYIKIYVLLVSKSFIYLIQ